MSITKTWSPDVVLGDGSHMLEWRWRCGPLLLVHERRWAYPESYAPFGDRPRVFGDPRAWDWRFDVALGPVDWRASMYMTSYWVRLSIFGGKRWENSEMFWRVACGSRTSDVVLNLWPLADFGVWW